MKNMEEVLIRVVAPHFVAGLVLRAGRVVLAAPILRWATGKPEDFLVTYFERKGWEAKICV